MIIILENEDINPQPSLEKIRMKILNMLSAYTWTARTGKTISIADSAHSLDLGMIEHIVQMYDTHLFKNYISNTLAKNKTKIKFMLNQTFQKETKLAYWNLFEEKHYYDAQFSFTVSLNVILWRKIWKGMSFVPPSQVDNSHPFTTLMLLVENYLNVFVMVSKYGHSARTTQQHFTEIYLNESTINIFPVFEKFLVDNEGSVVHDMFDEGDKKVVWKKNSPVAVVPDTLQDISIDVYQRNMLLYG